MTVTLALLLWPLVAAVLFLRFSIPVAIALTVIGGYLLLPQRGALFDLPVLPPVNKTLIPALSALVFAAIALSRQRRARQAGRVGIGLPPSTPSLEGWLPRSTLGIVLMVMLFGGSLLTGVLNSDTLRYGPTTVDGLDYRAVGNFLILNAVMILPLILARKFLAHPDQHRTLLMILCLAGVAYSFLALYEVRMSPQLSRTVYGFFPHSWIQHKRDGGWRPIVFLNHGLWLGIFLCCATLAAGAMFRLTTGAVRLRYLAATLWLFATLFLVKTFGAFLICVALLPAVLFLSARMQFLAAACLSLMLLSYPALRTAGLVPLNAAISFVEEVRPGRVGSLVFRIQNEDMILEKAHERPIFGWGSHGRWRVIDESGRDVTVSDGFWTITIGEGGWVHYIAVFGLLGLPIVIMAFRPRRYAPALATSSLGLVLTANMIDLIPNAGITPVTWLMAGALLGRLELAREVSDVPAEAPSAGAWTPSYSRPARPVPQRAGDPGYARPPAAALPRGPAPTYARPTPQHGRRVD